MFFILQLFSVFSVAGIRRLFQQRCSARMIFINHFIAATAKQHSLLVAAKRERRQSAISYRILRIILFQAKIILTNIGIQINKYAYLNIVYFCLAYIWLTDQTKPNFRLFPFCFLKTHSQKRKPRYCVFSLFAATLSVILHNFTELSSPIYQSYRIFQKMSYLCPCELHIVITVTVGAR